LAHRNLSLIAVSAIIFMKANAGVKRRRSRPP
jgi:hypothetical protein